MKEGELLVGLARTEAIRRLLNGLGSYGTTYLSLQEILFEVRKEASAASVLHQRARLRNAEKYSLCSPLTGILAEALQKLLHPSVALFAQM